MQLLLEIYFQTEDTFFFYFLFIKLSVLDCIPRQETRYQQGKENCFSHGTDIVETTPHIVNV